MNEQCFEIVPPGKLARVLVLPRRDGGMVLLSPQRPEALLAALRQAATGDSARGRG